jgi:acyl-CoA synthetase (AMP-forming)/AMP-acid ligase II
MRLFDLLDLHAREHPDIEFASQDRRSLTYAQAAEESHRLAHALVANGIQQGERVAILSKNCIEYILLYFAAARAGVVPVPLNYRLAPPEWRYIINDAGVVAVVASTEYMAAIDDIRSELTSLHRLFLLGNAAPSGWLPLLAQASEMPTSPVDRDVTQDDDAYQMYTSGTTGHPKGAVITHRALTTNMAQNALHCQGPVGERSLVVTPLFHAATVPSTFAPVWWCGSMLVHEQFEAHAVVGALDEERVGFAMLVPAMILTCLTVVPDVTKRDYPQLRLIYYGASPIAEQTLRNAMSVFKCQFVQTYGLTEATQLVTVLNHEDHQHALSARPELLLSAGRPAVGTEVRVLSQDGEPIPIGQTGQLAVRGPQLMRGYWQLPEATNETLRDGWLMTGDAASMDADGYVYIQDRVKDMIISGGENIYPREVENILFEHPAIVDAAVIGVPDGRWGETVKAFVVFQKGLTATTDEVIEFCRPHLAGFKLPRSVEVIDAIPRTTTGKVLKRELREPYWAGRNRHIAGS